MKFSPLKFFSSERTVLLDLRREKSNLGTIA